MATRKTPEYKGKHDVTTLAGFLAAYDELAQLFNGVHRWCDSGMRYPYETTKDKATGEQLIVRPDRREKASEAGVLADLADEDLTDSGKAKIAALRNAGLDKARRGAYNAMLYGLDNGYLTSDEMKVACKALGIAELVHEGGHPGSVAVYFQSPEHLTDEQQTIVREAADAAVKAITAIDGFEFREGTYVASDYEKTSKWSVPADATAGK
jgi:hypothetical protein